ncbi:4-hydroxy-tetrahydrodipicolinate synthase [Formosa algae]|uniref:4-hydroxy-tetrahydrodipicolinate synthase n=1 Tax=Formosa algae TaxID=225843 RepID=A0A9X0YKF5_9FLAO|nr:4-hydroxy-tetrahydrodipicolinate synthase [Formosa algae]MBP1840220.1 4-hydroxy-tetrahydrodipicolinate synthase [Formosa algae]MDQ0335820.1 4-hydroxy-tetrahydrodipicolinate synthase [Formosa algae]OEI80966.1 4-hydroxy-tetrahydrodipicolinate synthase [Formosa algae]
MNSKLIGTGVALVTPFKADLSVDHDALTQIVNFNIENGTNYLVIMGTTGESVTVTKAEKEAVIKTITETNNGRIPLVLGIGGNNTAAVVEEIKATDLSPFEAILSVSPYYSKPTQEGVYQHFKAVSEACPINIVLYNVPGRTASNMLPETTIRLANDFENIVAIKEAGNNIGQYLKLLKDKPEDFLVISGDDDLALGVVLAGGSGVISVIGQAVPAQFSKMIQLGLEGKAKEAYAIHYKLMDVVGYIFEENNPSGIKAVFEALDLCHASVRLPLVEATARLKDKIRAFVAANK